MSEDSRPSSFLGPSAVRSTHHLRSILDLTPLCEHRLSALMAWGSYFVLCLVRLVHTVVEPWSKGVVWVGVDAMSPNLESRSIPWPVPAELPMTYRCPDRCRPEVELVWVRVLMMGLATILVLVGLVESLMEPMTPLTHRLMKNRNLVPTSGRILVLQEFAQHRVPVGMLKEADERPVERPVAKILHQMAMAYRALVGEARLPACSPLAVVLLP